MKKTKFENLFVKSKFNSPVVDNGDQDLVRGRKSDFESESDFITTAKLYMNDLTSSHFDISNVCIESLLLVNNILAVDDFNSVEGLTLDIDDWYVADCQPLMCTFCETDKGVVPLKDEAICKACQSELNKEYGNKLS